MASKEIEAELDRILAGYWASDMPGEEECQSTWIEALTDDWQLVEALVRRLGK